jgi:hypothetical protein
MRKISSGCCVSVTSPGKKSRVQANHVTIRPPGREKHIRGGKYDWKAGFRTDAP